MSTSVRLQGTDSRLRFNVNEPKKAAQENKVTECVNVHRSSNSIQDVSQDQKEKITSVKEDFPLNLTLSIQCPP